MNKKAFQQLLKEKGHELYRSMPWRDDTRPYYVLVSELMLQQTQVERVKPKFAAFVEAFPDEQSLAAAPLSDVLVLWSGLGYNRRARFLHEAAKKIVTEFGGKFPSDAADIVSLPGVGKNTCGAILAYAFNKPSLYIETNIRTVYIHHFFDTGDPVDDTDILALLKETIDEENPREFYWALMDYGSYLKKNGSSHLTQSRQYKKQSALKGSVREIRGQMLKRLAEHDYLREELAREVTYDDRFELALNGLVKDKLIVVRADGLVHLTK
jgi:A/G-specific adenine glycosylase